MRKKNSILIAIAFLMIFHMFSVPAYASQKQDLEKIQAERKELQENLSLQEKEINNLYEEIQTLDEEIKRLEELVKEKQKKVDELTKKINATIEEIKKLQEEISQLEQSIDERFEILKSRASSYQKSGGFINYLEVLFGSQSFGDFISRLTAVNQIMDSDTQLMDQLEMDMAQLEERRAQTFEMLNELNVMHAEQEEELAQIETEKQEQEKVQETLQQKQQELLAYVEQLQKEDARLQSMEAEVKRQIAEAERRAREERERQRAAEEQKKGKSEIVQVASVKQKNNDHKSTESNKLESENSFTVTATAYTANCKGCSGVTSTGINLKKNPDTKVIAVDPSVIPLGSVVQVEGYGYAIAGDTGGAIVGKKIDVFFPTKQAAYKWGVRQVKVTIQ